MIDTAYLTRIEIFMRRIYGQVSASDERQYLDIDAKSEVKIGHKDKHKISRRVR